MWKKIIALVVIVSIAFSCGNDDNNNNGGGGSADNFNRKAMLTNWADNIIIPSYQSLATSITSFKTSVQNFTATPNQFTLTALRLNWLGAYKKWQHVEMFNIGKAETLNYGFHMNVYPTNITDIENNVVNGSYDLSHPNNHDAQGFPAIDYLINGLGADDTAILAKYTSDTNAAKYKTYLTDVVNKMDNLTQQVVTDWNGAYKTTFINNDGNTATGSVNKLVNDFIYYYEKGLRANKIGIPAGVWSATTLPSKVEAFYKKDISKELAQEALTAVKDFFNGKYYNGTTTGSSLKSYLDYLNTIKDGVDLSLLINTRLNDATTQLQGLNANFVTQINSNNQLMTQTYDKLQLAVVLFKVDMLQALNISVDYVDADGD